MQESFPAVQGHTRPARACVVCRPTTLTNPATVPTYVRRAASPCKKIEIDGATQISGIYDLVYDTSKFPMELVSVLGQTVWKYEVQAALCYCCQVFGTH